MPQSEVMTADQFLPSPHRKSAVVFRQGAVICSSIAILIVFLVIYTRNNTFSMQYHPDEPTKAAEVVDNTRNWHHPALLLDATYMATRLLHSGNDLQTTVEAGRSVSAFFAAIGVVALSLVGFLEGGFLGMFVVAAMVGFCPFLLTYAHYMKEDASLGMGTALLVLATRLVWLPSQSNAHKRACVMFLAAMCAVAASTKYIGALAFLSWFCLFYPRYSWKELFLWFPITAVVTWLVINHRAVSEWPHFQDAFVASARQPFEAFKGVMLPIPNMYYFHVIWLVVPFGTIALLCWTPALLVIRPRTDPWDLMLIGLTCATLVALCFERAAFPRYALPAVLLIELLAGLTIVWSWELFQVRNRAVLIGWRSAILIVAVLLAGAQVYRCINALDQFKNDSRDRVRDWIVHNLNDGDIVAADGYARLVASSGDHLDIPGGGEILVKTAMWLPNIGSLDQLRAKHVRYVLLCDLAYERFTNGFTRGDPDDPDWFQYRRAWYLDVLLNGQLVWSSTPTPNLMGYTNPEIRLYKLE